MLTRVEPAVSWCEKDLWCAVSPMKDDAAMLFYGASASKQLITDLLTGDAMDVETVTLVLDSRGNDVTVD